MATAFQTHFGNRTTILGENADLHMMVQFQTKKIPDADLMARVVQVGIGLISAAPQYLGENPGHEFIFSFMELDEGAIATGISKLAAILF
jgi:GntR family transcriptional regulator/MocR family aminotransferase